MKAPLVLAVVLLSVMSLPAPAAEERPAPRTDVEGFALPAGVLSRIGSARFRRLSWLEQICWSRDGKRVAAAGPSPGDGICVWDFASGKTVRWAPAADSEEWVKALAFSADGQVLAVLRSRQDNGLLARIDPATGAVQKRALGVKVGIDSERAFSHGGGWLAVARDQQLLLFDTTAAKAPQRFDVPREHDSLAVDDTGRWLVLSHAKGVLVLDTRTGKRTTVGEKDACGKIVVAHRKGLFAGINRGEDQWTIDVLSLEEGARRQRFSFAGEEPSPTQISFSPDDRSILVRCDESRAIALYDLEARKWLWQVSTFPHQPRDAAFSPDGKVIGLTGLGTAPVFLDAATGKLDPHTPDLFDGPRPLAFPSQRQVLVQSGGFEIRDAATGRRVRKLPSIPRKERFVPWEWGVTPSPQESYGWYWHDCCAHDGGQVFAFAAMKSYRADGRTGKALPCPDIPVAKWRRVVCSSDGAQLVGLAYQKDRGIMAQVWDVAKGERQHSLFNADDEDYHLVPGDNPRLLLSSIDTRIRLKNTPPEATVRLWDIVTGRLLASFTPQGRPLRYGAPALSPDGGTVAAPSWMGSQPAEAKQALVQFWEVKTARSWPTLSLDLLKQKPRSIALVPGGGMAAIGCEDGRLLLWEVASGKVRGTFRHESEVDRVRFSPVDRLLAAASAEAPIYLWDVYGTQERAAPVRPAAALWDDLLADDATRAFAALKQLIRSPRQAVEMLTGKLKPLPADSTGWQRLVADLDSADFQTRERATAALLKLDERADAFLRTARKGTTTQEAQRRLDRILRRPIHLAAEALRALRAIEVLEVIGSPEAAAALERMAAGPAEDRLTEAAKEARARIQGRKKM